MIQSSRVYGRRLAAGARRRRGVAGHLAAVVIATLVWCNGTVAAPIEYQNPVLPGDYADPSVIRVGREYWATATSSEWAPLFPLLRSRDLVHWQQVGNVFARRPEWAVGNFWAPEISEYQGRFYIYYVGRKRGGPLSLAVATAKRPEGPWTDHGPMMSQAAGSIDAVTAVDDGGTRWLLWKEDGNSRKQPTPIWGQALSKDGTKLVGEMKELFRNDAPWENNLVEGPFIRKRGEYFYCFYSGNACCGLGCNYALGVARAKSLTGPWEKLSRNPILAGNDTWRCPGHGSIVTTAEGRDFLLYHAYHARNFIYAGRQGVLDEVVWGADGWPSINDGRGPSVSAPAPLSSQAPSRRDKTFLGSGFADDFSQKSLRPEWQWPVNQEPGVKIEGGWLTLTSSPEQSTNWLGGVLGVKTTAGEYQASTILNVATLTAGARAGLSAFGDAQNALGFVAGDRRLTVYRRQKGQQREMGSAEMPAGEKIHLRLTASGGHRFRFAVSADGKAWTGVGDDVDLEGDYLPPWDRGIRVALTVGGVVSARAQFDHLRLE